MHRHHDHEHRREEGHEGRAQHHKEGWGSREGWRGRRGHWEFRFGPGRRGGPEWGGPGGPGSPGDPAWGGPPWGRPGRRQRRGDIRFALLELLAEQPRHGYELIKELERRFGGFYKPSPGSVYPTLQLLEDEGHLTSDSVEGKRIYTITESGKAVLADRGAAHGGPWRHHGPGGEREERDGLHKGMEALLGGVMQVGRHGTAEQVRAAAEILERARREVYAILAGTGGPAPSEGRTERLD